MGTHEVLPIIVTVVDYYLSYIHPHWDPEGSSLKKVDLPVDHQACMSSQYLVLFTERECLTYTNSNLYNFGLFSLL